MLLVSYEFLAFILVLGILYYTLPKGFQWILLLIASYVFYAMAGWKAIVFVLVTTISTWILGKQIGKITDEEKDWIAVHSPSKEERKERKVKNKARQWRLLIFGLCLNFGIMAVLKYTNFAIENVNGLLHLFGSEISFGFVKWMLPLGLSYYTFQSMGYLIDVYRRKYRPEENLGHMALFVSFFPQLIQGPITKFDEMKDEFFREHPFCFQEVCLGLQRVLWGYFKKLVIADRLAQVIIQISQDMETYQGVYVWIGMISFTIQIYADFSGGIDIVIGIAQAFGIRLPENFLRPYFSKTVPEYWRRWHMSLMMWLREYIFYPTSVCKPVIKLAGVFKQRLGNAVGRRVPVYVTSVLVWLVVGIWHGATWGYVIWGLIHCAILLSSQEFMPIQKKFHSRFDVSGKLWFRIFQVLRTLLILSLVQMLEYYYTVDAMLRMQWNMFTQTSFGQLLDGRFWQLGLSGFDWAAVVMGTALIVVVELFQRRESVRKQIAEKPAAFRFVVWYGLFLIVIIIGAYGQGYDASQFIYNQF